MTVQDSKVSLKKLRVAMLVSGDKFGGAERMVLTLCNAARENFEPILFQTLAGSLTRAAERVGFPVRTDLVGKSLIESGRALARILREEKFDVIHTHGYRSATIAALAILFGKRLPVVRTMHGAPEPKSPGKMGINETIGNLSGMYSLAKRVFVSRELVHKMSAPRRSRVIYNGVNTDVTAGPKPREYGARVNLVAVGRLEPVKGLDTLIEALTHDALVHRVHLHLVGEGPDMKALKALVKAKGLGSAVSFHGFKVNSLDYIAHADFLLLPSLHEGVPYVLLEALALKTPVVASNVGGIPEVVRNGQEALLVTPRSTYDLVRILRRAIPDAPAVAKMAEAGYRRVLTEFSATVMADRYAELYRALAKR